jgi:hypothetical protein
LKGKAQYVKASDVPGSIKVFLDSIFPVNKYPVWKTNGNCSNCLFKYEATFAINKSRHWVTFDIFGKLLAIENDIEMDSLPESSLKYIDENYERKLIISTRKITKGNQVMYFACLKGNRLTHYLFFLEDGKLYKDKGNLIEIILNASIQSLLLSNY